jgi:protein-tyrosine phosphatase
MRLCFVCMGNICRSPTAHGVMEHLVREAGLAGRIEIDSAGTGAWHVGELPDPRARAAAKKRGYDLSHRARRFTSEDFTRFDLVLAMDRENLASLHQLARGSGHAGSVRLLRSFDPDAPEGAEVPDPYYREDDGFEHVLDMCERACRGLLEHVRARL